MILQTDEIIGIYERLNAKKIEIGEKRDQSFLTFRVH